MTRPAEADLSLWQQRRDQALRDLSELQAQVDHGDMPASVAAPLRLRYLRTAADAIAVVEAGTGGSTGGADEVAAELPDDGSPGHAAGDQSGPTGSGARRRRSRSWAAAYAGGAVIAVLAVFLLPRYVGARPAGGFVTGNEMLQAAPTGTATAGPVPVPVPAPVPSGSPTSGRDLSKVTTAEMEQVVAANPRVIGMRLALARRYLLAGQYPSAARHYATVLQQQPDNVQARAGSAWILLKAGEARQAMTAIEQALAVDRGSVDALWVKANIELYGLSNPAGALDVLAQLRALPDLPAGVAGQAAKLADLARARQRGGS